MNTPNDINSTITTEDQWEAVSGRQSPAIIAEEIMEHLRNACPFGTAFIRDIPMGVRGQVESELKHTFENWANTWIAPKLRVIIAKQYATRSELLAARTGKANP